MTTNGESKDPVQFPETGGQQQEGAPTITGPTGDPVSDALLAQAKTVQDLGLRVAYLLDTTKDTFVKFLMASEDFYQMIRALREAETVTNDNSPTDRPTA